MRKGSDVIGKLVVTYDTGKKIERIQDLIFDQDQNQLLGFLVQEKGLFQDAKVIPLPEVKAIGADALVVNSKVSVVEAHRIRKIKEILHYNNILKGTKILTTDGLNLGTMVDLFFDEHSGVVEGYEVSGGLFADAYSGRSFVPASYTLKIGQDVAFVPPETARLMEEQVGGIKGAGQAVDNRLQESVETANRKLQEAGQIANEKLQAANEATNSKLQELNRTATTSLTNSLVDPAAQKAFVVGKRVEQDVPTPGGAVLLLQGQEVTLVAAEEAERLGVLDALYSASGGSLTAKISRNLQEARESAGSRIQRTTQSAAVNIRRSVDGLAAQGTVDQARGCRAMHTVRTDDGFIIVALGQIVTDVVIDRARTYGKEAALLNAVGLAPAAAVRSSASDTWAETKLQLHDHASVAQENISTFWQNLREKAEELQGRSTRAIKQQRIEQALGRPVTRVILDLEDNVILNVGELITHRAIRQAKEGGVLNILLSSVYTKEPEIADKELRAPESGMAALEFNGRTQGITPKTDEQSE